MHDLPHYAAYYRWLLIKNHLHVFAHYAERVLDVGCDDGYLLRKTNGTVRVGVDLKPRLRPDQQTQVSRASVEHLPLLSATFDCVLAFDILEHVPDDHALMREMTRVLAPQGVIWFSTPSLEHQMIPSFLTARANRAFGHVRNGYTPEQIKSLLPDASVWQVDYLYWNEPFFRMGFAPLHFVNLVWPWLALRLTDGIYRMDGLMSEGAQGHLIGSIRRR